MAEFDFSKKDSNSRSKIIKDSVGFVDRRDDRLLPTLNSFSYFVEGIFIKNETLVMYSTKEKTNSSSAEYRLKGLNCCFLELSSSKNDTDSSRNIELKFIKVKEDVFHAPEILNINLDSELGKNIVFKMRDDVLRNYSKRMGHLLAEVCIRAELGTNTPIFYSRIGCETRDGHYIRCDSNLSQDISNAVRSAKLSDPSKSIATIMVSCRYSNSGISDDGHTICIAVNTNKFKFDENGKLSNDTKLTPEDCAIIDSSRAIIDYDMYHTQRDYGIREIYSQLNQLIDVSSIKTYSLYLKSIQVGPKCSDYARRAYQELSSGHYTDIADLKNRSFEFANSIHESVQRDYERVFKGENNIPGHIKNELNDKAPKENDYPARFIPTTLRARNIGPLASTTSKKKHGGTFEPPTKEKIKEQVNVEKLSQPSVEGFTEEQGDNMGQLMQTSPLINTADNPVLNALGKCSIGEKVVKKPFNQHVRPHSINPNAYTGNKTILHNQCLIVKPKLPDKPGLARFK